MLSFAALNSGCSSVGRVHVWGACGRRFKSCHPDQKNPLRVAMDFFYIHKTPIWCLIKFEVYLTPTKGVEAMKTREEWFSEYGESHRNPTNKLIHWICVPLIFYSVIALLSSIPNDLFIKITGDSDGIIWHWGTVAVILSLFFYLWLSPVLTIGMAFFSSFCISVILMLRTVGISPLPSAIVIFAIAWVGQFYGHKLEGKKPSFLKDMLFLLIGPAWLLHQIKFKFWKRASDNIIP